MFQMENEKENLPYSMVGKREVKILIYTLVFLPIISLLKQGY
jgi:hypothetical protein